MTRAMTNELRVRAGINLDEPTMSLLRLHDALTSLYGEAVAEMILESMIVNLQEIAEIGNN
ncbi:MAG TPA: hypothetical protein VJP79_07625 [Nitrososphaera sp.]|nr:hypothetical protein [Nitrososphaera sp.]